MKTTKHQGFALIAPNKHANSFIIYSVSMSPFVAVVAASLHSFSPHASHLFCLSLSHSLSFCLTFDWLSKIVHILSFFPVRCVCVQLCHCCVIESANHSPFRNNINQANGDFRLRHTSIEESSASPSKLGNRPRIRPFPSSITIHLSHSVLVILPICHLNLIHRRRRRRHQHHFRRNDVRF